MYIQQLLYYTACIHRSIKMGCIALLELNFDVATYTYYLLGISTRNANHLVTNTSRVCLKTIFSLSKSVGKQIPIRNLEIATIY